MTTPAVITVLTQQQRDILVGALFDKLAETESYLRSYGDGDAPGPMDACCPAHLAQFEARLEQRDALRERRRRIRDLISGLEGAEPEIRHERKENPDE